MFARNDILTEWTVFRKDKKHSSLLKRGWLVQINLLQFYIYKFKISHWNRTFVRKLIIHLKVINIFILNVKQPPVSAAPPRLDYILEYFWILKYLTFQKYNRSIIFVYLKHLPALHGTTKEIHLEIIKYWKFWSEQMKVFKFNKNIKVRCTHNNLYGNTIVRSIWIFKVLHNNKVFAMKVIDLNAYGGIILPADNLSMEDINNEILVFWS